MFSASCSSSFRSVTDLFDVLSRHETWKILLSHLGCAVSCLVFCLPLLGKRDREQFWWPAKVVKRAIKAALRFPLSYLQPCLLSHHAIEFCYRDSENVTMLPLVTSTGNMVVHCYRCLSVSSPHRGACFDDRKLGQCLVIPYLTFPYVTFLYRNLPYLKSPYLSFPVLVSYLFLTLR